MEVTNSILEANLSAISKYNPELAAKIKSIEFLKANISITETNLKEPNILYNGIPVHAQDGAELEASNIFDKTTDTGNHIHIIFGLGLGYLFKHFCEKSLGVVVLFEPDVEQLKAVFEIVDFTQELNKKKIYVTSSYKDIEDVFSATYSLKAEVKCHFLKFHAQQRDSELSALAHELGKIKTLYECNYQLQTTKNYMYYINTLESFTQKLDALPFDTLKNKFKNIPAIIVSAGPSLGKQIEILKEMQNKAIIFCVGTAYKTLVKHGIKPDFLNVIEMLDCSVQLEGCDLSEINFISEAYTNKRFYDFKFKRKLITLSKENHANHWFADITNNNLDEYETKGTVSYNALNCATIAGCNPIILLGQDLAYTEGQCYASGSAYSSLKVKFDEKLNKYIVGYDDVQSFKKEVFTKTHPFNNEEKDKYIDDFINDLNEKMCYVKGQNGQMLPTSPDYALFVQYFNDYREKIGPDTILINSSTGGAELTGFANVELSKLNEAITITKPNIEELFKSITYTTDIESIKYNIQYDINILEELLVLFANARIDLKNFKLEINRHKTLNKKANNYLRKCLDKFLEVIKIYKPRSHMIECITKVQESRLTWILKEKDGQYDYNTQLEVIEALEKYFYLNVDKFNVVNKKLELILEKLNKI